MASTIYLHWTATHDGWIRPGHYHSIVTGDGQVHRLHAYDVALPAHTWRRNTDSVALAVACMGGMPDPWTQAPSPLQLSSLCQEAASLVRRLGWSAEEITLQRVMTHAEAAANRDGRMLHDNLWARELGWHWGTLGPVAAPSRRPLGWWRSTPRANPSSLNDGYRTGAIGPPSVSWCRRDQGPRHNPQGAA